MSELHWKQSITGIDPNKVTVRGYPVDELIGEISFSEVIYLVLRGELPDPRVGELIDAILVSSVDHGATPPSTLAALTTASTGAPLNAAIASGILSINKFHGGAIEEAMHTFLETADLAEDEGIAPEEAVEQVLIKFKAANRRVMGFGHRVHSDDPRKKRLFTLANKLGIAGKFVQLANRMEQELSEQIGKKLPLNVDGAIAALLCDLEFSPDLANAFFIIARLPGLVAHIQEEKTRYRPMRKIHPTDHEYDGPPERHYSRQNSDRKEE